MDCTGHSHDHSHADEPGHSLHQYIDKPNAFCLNERHPNTGRQILKTHEDRFTSRPSLRSEDDDPELLLHIPFTEAVTIKSLSVLGPAGVSSDDDDAETTTTTVVGPRNISLFCNRDDLDFETVRDLPPAMRWELLPPEHVHVGGGHDHDGDGSVGTVDYPLRPAGRFQNVSSLTIYFEDNYGEEGREWPTEITYVGLKGKGTNMKRVAVETVYEQYGMKKDHKVKGDEYGARHLL